ncbi:MAG: hypothetical protein IJ083_11765 [Clostridia bacterium]|nr:hypothetical protein [Clostridia bacterium]
MARSERVKEEQSSLSSSVVRYQERNNEVEIDLAELFVRLLEKWYLILVAALIGTILAGVYTFRFVTPMYQSTCKLYVVNSKDSAINISDLQLGNYLAKDYTEVFTNWHVHERVLQKLGLDYTYQQMNNMVKVTNPSDTRILYITVTNPDPVEAKELADAYASVACEFIAVKMDTQQPNIFEEARVPVNPSSPNKTRNIIIGFLLGAILAVGIIVIQFITDDYVRTPEDIEKLLGLPTLGAVTEQETLKQANDHQKKSRHKANKSKGGSRS